MSSEIFHHVNAQHQLVPNIGVLPDLQADGRSETGTIDSHGIGIAVSAGGEFAIIEMVVEIRIIDEFHAGFLLWLWCAESP